MINYVLLMLQICLAFSPLYLGYHLSEVGDIFCTVGCSQSLEDFISLSLQSLDMLVDPWLMDFVSSELLLGDIFRHKFMYFTLELGPQRINVLKIGYILEFSRIRPQF